MRIYFMACFFALLLVPVILINYDYSYLQSLLGGVLLMLCLYPLARYFAVNEQGIPTFPVLCLAYAAQFGLPVFTREAIMNTVDGRIYLQEQDVLIALALAIIGVGALQMGYFGVQRAKIGNLLPVIRLNLNLKKAIIYSIIFGLALPFAITLEDLAPGNTFLSLSAFRNLLQNQVLVAVGIVGGIVFSGRGSKWHRYLLYLIVLATVVRGISSAVLEQAVIPIAVLFMTKWLYNRKLPVGNIVTILLLVLFLSPVKGALRQEVWGDSSVVGRSDDSQSNTAVLWVDKASRYWQEAFTGQRDMSEATADAASRTDFLHQFAYIYSLTPTTIPYQYGATYSYFAVAWIPRVIWPDKPEAGKANNFFAVSYRVTTEEGVKRSTFGVSLLAEGYINFGALGVILIMLLQGAIFGSLQHAFGSTRAGLGGQAVFLAFFVFFLNGVGTSAEIFFGNIVQNLICNCVLLWWARESSLREILGHPATSKSTA